MKILIVDDSVGNLEAAKLAAKDFTDHEFVFLNFAKEAMCHLVEVDAIITDLFFPNEIHNDEGELSAYYTLFCSKLRDSSAFDDIVWIYYKGNRMRAEQKLQRNIAFLESGANSQFPYGGSIMLRAKELGKRYCLVSDIHRHVMDSDCVSAPDGIDGMIILLPLIEENIVSAKQVMQDGKDSLTYFGNEQLYDYGRGKGDPAIWIEAIRRILAQ